MKTIFLLLLLIPSISFAIPNKTKADEKPTFYLMECGHLVFIITGGTIKSVPEAAKVFPAADEIASYINSTPETVLIKYNPPGGCE